MKWLLLSWIAMGALAQEVERLDPALDSIIAPGARIEKLAGGLGFTEGPLWLKKQRFLIFSDIRANAILKWAEGDTAAAVYRKPSGFDGPESEFTGIRGSNGLAVDRQGRLLICQHGNRRLVRIERSGKVTVLADRYEGKRLNSPNDVVVRKDGAIYFTDPPYGLAGEDKSPEKELNCNGVYLLRDGRLTLEYRDLTRPNGLALSPDEKILYVANSDPNRKIWMRFDVRANGSLANGKVFFDATARREPTAPDGMKVDRRGNLFATGPTGVWILSPAGRALGIIKPAEVPANCAFGGPDGKELYMTARTGLYRVRVLTGR